MGNMDWDNGRNNIFIGEIYIYLVYITKKCFPNISHRTVLTHDKGQKTRKTIKNCFDKLCMIRKLVYFEIIFPNMAELNIFSFRILKLVY